jgi:cysteine desulfurase / selenocysteine lyase
VLRQLRHRARDGDIEVTHVANDAAGYIDPDDVKRAFRKHTRMVIINHASNVLGTVQPVAEIGKRCREAGIRLVVDVSQSAGIVPIDVTATRSPR